MDGYQLPCLDYRKTFFGRLFWGNCGFDNNTWRKTRESCAVYLTITGANGFCGWFVSKLKTKALPLRPNAALLASSKMRLCVFNDLADVTSTLHAATTKSVSTRTIKTQSIHLICAGKLTGSPQWLIILLAIPLAQENTWKISLNRSRKCAANTFLDPSIKTRSPATQSPSLKDGSMRLCNPSNLTLRP